MTVRAFVLAVAVGALVPEVGRAQHAFGGAGVTHNGYPYGPRVAPPWGYPGLYGGPFVTYPPAPLPYGAPSYDRLGPNIGVYTANGFPGFGPGFGYGGFGPGFGYGYYGRNGFYGSPGRAGSSWSNGLSLYGPPVPVYGPVPGVFGNNDLVRQYRNTLGPAFPGYGWIGIYAASPRPRHPNVSVWPTVESFAPLATPGVHTPGSPLNSGGCLILSVKVPQPSAEVFVDGTKTAQTGTDRIFESPPLAAGKAFKYTVTARWVERGQVVESSREVTGTPGEVVRVDFGTGK